MLCRDSVRTRALLPPLLPLLWLAGLVMSLPLAAHAGRPITSEDGTGVKAGRCLVEVWGEREDQDRSWSVAQACGVWPGVELGIDLTRYQAGDPKWQRSAGLSLKLAPEGWQWPTALGPLSFELNLAMGYERPAGKAWHSSDASLTGMASLELGERWVVNAHLGTQRERRTPSRSGNTTGSAGLGLSYQASERTELFAELQSPLRRTGLAAAQRTLGSFVWLQPDVLGLSLSVGRASGSTLWSAGISRYGLGL